MDAETLRLSDLVPGNIYENDKAGANTITALMQTRPEYASTQRSKGFRIARVIDSAIPKHSGHTHAFLVIVSGDTKLKAERWKDEIVNHQLVYFGDNPKYPNVMDTIGNRILDKIFSRRRIQTEDVYPVFYFELLKGQKVRFMGTCFPIPDGLSEVDQDGIPNFQAHFYIDQHSVITKSWLTDLKEGHWRDSSAAPEVWKSYILEADIQEAKQQQAELINFEPEDDYLGAMVAKRMTTYRLTQEKFRKRLERRQKACLICGIANHELLNASHVKPWAVSSDAEKIDPENGLLLCTLHDRLFDRHLISFSEAGRLLISNRLEATDVERAGLKDGQYFSGLEKHQKYLAFHRKEFTQSENRKTN